MTALREAAQQALEALEKHQEALKVAPEYTLAPHECEAMDAAEEAITALRAALAQEQAEPKPMHPELRKMWEELAAMPQQAEPLNLSDRAVQRRLAAQWGYVPAEQAEPALQPVARVMISSNVPGRIDEMDVLKALPRGEHLLYTAPPRRTMVPLTDEEILAAVGWERAEMYMKLTPNFPVDEAKKETLKNARAIEKASWEKNHG